jgi:hypothetical protein
MRFTPTLAAAALAASGASFAQTKSGTCPAPIPQATSTPKT